VEGHRIVGPDWRDRAILRASARRRARAAGAP
jgi:hypothetical protein